jgi:hypothetical protein
MLERISIMATSKHFLLPHAPVKVHPMQQVVAATDIAQMNAFKCIQTTLSSCALAPHIDYILRLKASKVSPAGEQYSPGSCQSVDIEHESFRIQDIPKNKSIDWRTALWATLSRNDPYSVTTLEA